MARASRVSGLSWLLKMINFIVPHPHASQISLLWPQMYISSFLSMGFILFLEIRYSFFMRYEFFYLLFIYYFYFWLCWVFVSVWGLSPVAASGGRSSSRCAGLSLSRPLLLGSTGSRRSGSVVVAHGPSCSAACGIFPDQGSNPYSLHWQADSQPLRHQGSPRYELLMTIYVSGSTDQYNSWKSWNLYQLRLKKT